MTLYHFTSWVAYTHIVASGEINTSESNIGSKYPEVLPYGEHVGPDVVWMTTKPTPEANGIEIMPERLHAWSQATGLDSLLADKSKVRLTLNLPVDEVEEWQRWSEAQGINPRWRQALEEGRAAWSWRVIVRPVLADEITEVAVDEAVMALIGLELGESTSTAL